MEEASTSGPCIKSYQLPPSGPVVVLEERADPETNKQSNEEENNELDVTFEDDSVTEGDAPDANHQLTGQPPKKRRKIKETLEDAKDQSDDKDDDALDQESESAVENVSPHNELTPPRTRRSTKTSNPKAGSSEQMQNAGDVTQQRNSTRGNSGSAGVLSDNKDDDDGFEQKQKPRTPNRNVQTPNKTPASWERQRPPRTRRSTRISNPTAGNSQPSQSAGNIKQQRKTTQRTSENLEDLSDNVNIPTPDLILTKFVSDKKPDNSQPPQNAGDVKQETEYLIPVEEMKQETNPAEPIGSQIGTSARQTPSIDSEFENDMDLIIVEANRVARDHPERWKVSRIAVQRVLLACEENDFASTDDLFNYFK